MGLQMVIEPIEIKNKILSPNQYPDQYQALQGYIYTGILICIVENQHFYLGVWKVN